MHVGHAFYASMQVSESASGEGKKPTNQKFRNETFPFLEVSRKKESHFRSFENIFLCYKVLLWVSPRGNDIFLLLQLLFQRWSGSTHWGPGGIKKDKSILETAKQDTLAAVGYKLFVRGISAVWFVTPLWWPSWNFVLDAPFFVYGKLV